MTTFGRADEDAESRFGVGWKAPDFVALARWVNPAVGVLGVLVLSGYFLTAASVATAPAPLIEAAAPPTPSPVRAQLALSRDAATSTAVQDESTRMSTIDLLKAVFGAVLALAWVIIGAWLGVRRARALTPVDENAYNGRATPGRGPICHRSNGETRLVPQHLWCAEFPAVKQDLPGSAKLHFAQGRALRKLDQVDDRRYGFRFEMSAAPGCFTEAER